MQPTLLAIDSIAAHCDGCSAACYCTNRMARSRSSGEYRLGRPMAPSSHSQGKSPPRFPVRFILALALFVEETAEPRTSADAAVLSFPDSGTRDQFVVNPLLRARQSGEIARTRGVKG